MGKQTNYSDADSGKFEEALLTEKLMRLVDEHPSLYNATFVPKCYVLLFSSGAKNVACTTDAHIGAQHTTTVDCSPAARQE